MRLGQALVAPALALLLTGSLAACSSGDDGEKEARSAATATAKALAAGAPEDGTWGGTTGDDVATAYDDIVAGLGDVEPTVEATVSEVSDDAASATLTWTWPVGRGEEWRYDAPLGLQRDGDAWRPVWSPKVVEPSLKDGEALTATTVQTKRGRIIGAHGSPLVEDRPVQRYGIDRSKASKAKAVASARTLAGLVGIDVAPYVKAVRGAGDRAFVEAITYRRGEVPAAVRSDAARLPGVLVVDDTLPLAPTKEFAAPILGRVGPVTAEMVEDDPDTYRAGDIAGVSGLQARYDDQLRGRPGVVIDAVTTGDAPEERELYRVQPVRGEKLATTLDPGLQTSAERLLGGIDPAAALVAIRPSDGAILAAANGPGTEGRNDATYAQAAPGSTFKIVSSLALLRGGLTPDSTVPCTPSIDVDGKRFENYDDYPAGSLGDVPLRTAIAQSCNTAVISQRDRLSADGLADAAASLGVGVDHDLGFPAYFGSVPDTGSETERAAAMIGQGKVLASPMAMAAVIASVQRGDVVVPRLLPQVKVKAPKHTPLTSTEAQQLRAMLRQAVTDGSASGLADLPGAPVIAKTGTAEFEDGGQVRTHAWMVAAQGDLAVAVYVQLGESGSQSAGPVLEAFLRAAG